MPPITETKYVQINYWTKLFKQIYEPHADDITKRIEKMLED